MWSETLVNRGKHTHSHTHTHTHTSHASKEGMSNARKLCESLIESVKKEYETFKSAQSAPLGFGKSPGYSNNPGVQ